MTESPGPGSSVITDSVWIDAWIWLTAADENPNRATYLFLTEGADSLHIDDYERCFDLFDGNDADAVAAARERWTARKAENHTVTSAYS